MKLASSPGRGKGWLGTGLEATSYHVFIGTFSVLCRVCLLFIYII